jgi:hypothetical protein
MIHPGRYRRVEHVDLKHCAERVQTERRLRNLGPLGDLPALPVELFIAGVVGGTLFVLVNAAVNYGIILGIVKRIRERESTMKQLLQAACSIRKNQRSPPSQKQYHASSRKSVTSWPRGSQASKISQNTVLWEL